MPGEATVHCLYPLASAEKRFFMWAEALSHDLELANASAKFKDAISAFKKRPRRVYF